MKRRLHEFALLLSVVFLAMAGCATRTDLTEEEILGQDPLVVAPRAGTGGGITAMGEFEARGKLQAAREAFLRTDYEECLSIVRRTLEEGVPAEIAEELKTLRFDTKRRLLSRRVVAGRVRPVKDIFPVGDEIQIDLRLRNVSPHVLSIPLSASGVSSDSVFEVRVSRQDWDIQGNYRSVSGRYLVSPEGDLEVPIGADRAVAFSLPASPQEERHLGFTVLTIDGVFRPSSIQCGEDRYYSSVELQGAVVRILPAGYEPIAADPLGTLEKANRLRAREHLLLAAELAPPERRRGVIRRLMGYLDDASPLMGTTIMAALRRLTGREFANRPSAWKEWWKEGGRDGRD